jgi:hypothetical protein
MQKPFLSVIVPAIESSPFFEDILREIYEYARARYLQIECLIIEDRNEVCKKVGMFGQNEHFELKNIVNPRKLSYAHALWEGIKKAEGEWILLYDVVKSPHIGYFDRAFFEIKRGAKVVLGDSYFQIYRNEEIKKLFLEITVEDISALNELKKIAEKKYGDLPRGIKVINTKSTSSSKWWQKLIRFFKI